MARRFGYRLDAVKKKYQWDAQLAQQDLAQAGRLVDQAKDRVTAADDQAAGTENAIREVLQSGSSVDPATYASMLAFAATQREAVAAAEQTLAKMQRTHDQTLRHFQQMDQRRRVIDKHETRVRRYAMEAEQKQGQEELDELCLLRWGRGE